MSKMTAARTDGMRCITRIAKAADAEHRRGQTKGWQVRVIRRGISINELFSDARFGGRAGALSEAMHFRDSVVKELAPIPRSELARRIVGTNTSGIPGVRRYVKRTTIRGKTFEHAVWEASGTPEPRKRQVRAFSIKSLGEDQAREAAIAQRLRWEKQMARNEQKRLPKQPR